MRAALLKGLLGIMIFAASNLSAQQKSIPDACEYKKAKKDCKKELGKFKYDASQVTRVTFRNDEKQNYEIKIPLYWGEDYRFIFNREGVPQNVKINVYNKKKERSNRKKLFTSEDYPSDQKMIVWEPEKSRNMYINYTVPKSEDGKIKKGCIVVVLGYKI